MVFSHKLHLVRRCFDICHMPSSSSLVLRTDNRFATLPDAFYTRQPATGPLTSPWLVDANPEAAALIGLAPEA